MVFFILIDFKHAYFRTAKRFSKYSSGPGTNIKFRDKNQ